MSILDLKKSSTGMAYKINTDISFNHKIID